LTDAPDCVKPATPENLAEARAFALRLDARKRKRDAGEFMRGLSLRLLARHDVAGGAARRSQSALSQRYALRGR